MNSCRDSEQMWRTAGVFVKETTERAREFHVNSTIRGSGAANPHIFSRSSGGSFVKEMKESKVGALVN